MSKAQLKKRIFELDFAIHELVLFLDSHPTNKKACELLEDYKKKRKELIAVYEQAYGQFVMIPRDVPKSSCWKWLEGPWPWENNFMEG